MRGVCGPARGFSLLEVLIALTVLAVGIVSLVELFSGSLRTVKKSEDYSKAMIYARSLLDEAYAVPELKDIEGSFNLDEDFSAERTVKAVSSGEEDENKGTMLYEISVAVKWPSGEVRLRGMRAVSGETGEK